MSEFTEREFLEPYHPPLISGELMVKIEERLNYRNLMMKKGNTGAVCSEYVKEQTE